MFTFLIETFILGLKNLRLHKLRSLLTALGIIIGVTAVIIMVAIGEGTKQEAMRQLQELGARNVLLRSTKPQRTAEVQESDTRTLVYGLKRADLKLLETVPTITTIVPMRDTEQPVVHGSRRANAAPIGTTPKLWEVLNLNVMRGRYWTQSEYEQLASVCVIGASVAEQLYPFQDPIGQTIRVGDSNNGIVMLTIVGVLEPTGLRGEGAAMINRDLDKDLYFPLTLAQAVYGDSTTVRQSGSTERKTIELTEVWLQVREMNEVETTAGITQQILASNHPGPADYEVKAPISILRSAERVQQQFNFIMVTIAAFALIVGGIGIMNIMLASVTERTREIGIRRALGAKRKHITLQFLIETTVISLSGGLIGILLGIGAAKALPFVIEMIVGGDTYHTAVATWSVVGSFVVSGMIGIGFGLYPAVMAARMNPIEALRHE